MDTRAIDRKFTFVSIADLGPTRRFSHEELLASTEGLYFDPEERFDCSNNVDFIRLDDGAEVNSSLIGAADYRVNHYSFRAPKVFWTRYCNVPITSDGRFINETITGNKETFDAYPFNLLPCTRRDGMDYFVHIDLSKVISKDFDVVLGSHAASGIFGHFVLDVGYSAFTFREEINSGRLKLALCSPSQIELDYLRLIGIDASGILAITDPVVQFRTAIMTSGLQAMPTHVPGRTMLEMFKTFAQNVFRKNWSLPDDLRVFFLRGDKRRVENEDEAAAVFAEFGFLCVRPKTLSLSLQAALVANSVVFASTHGSSLALAPAMKSGGTLIEIMPADTVDPWMMRLLTVTERKHVALLVDRAPSVIDTKRLREALARILA